MSLRWKFNSFWAEILRLGNCILCIQSVGIIRWVSNNCGPECHVLCLWVRVQKCRVSVVVGYECLRMSSCCPPPSDCNGCNGVGQSVGQWVDLFRSLSEILRWKCAVELLLNLWNGDLHLIVAVYSTFTIESKGRDTQEEEFPCRIIIHSQILIYCEKYILIGIVLKGERN